MKEHIDQPKKQQSVTPSHDIAEKGIGGTATFADNRTESMVQRKMRDAMSSSPVDENTAQLRKSIQVAGSGASFPIQRKANRTGLPDQLKSGIENLSGFAMDDVRVHYNSSKPAQLQAHAYAQGSDIHLAPGQEKHLGHEAWHVVQQKQGRVKPTRQLKSTGVNINDDAWLEKEADVMGAKAQSYHPLNHSEISTANQSNVKLGNVLQPVWKKAITKDDSGENVFKDDKSWWFMDIRTGLMWQEFEPKDQRPWNEWNRESNLKIKPPRPDAGVDIATSDYGMGFEEHRENWQAYANFIGEILKETRDADRQANVRRATGNKAGKKQRALLEYQKDFEIISKHDFNESMWDMAMQLMNETNYVCIVSEAGKSNVWVTARVLRLVEILGGTPPNAIKSVTAKEKGVRDFGMAFDIGVGESETIVFMDDASYSGAQMSKLIQKVMVGRENPVKVGLVAASEDAKAKIKNAAPTVEFLAKEGSPRTIKKYQNRAKLHAAQEGMGIALKTMEKDSAVDGDYQTALYYKLPDFASVRNELMSKGGFIAGYEEGETEPYKKAGKKLDEVVEVIKGKFVGRDAGRNLPRRGGKGAYASHGFGKSPFAGGGFMGEVDPMNDGIPIASMMVDPRKKKMLSAFQANPTLKTAPSSFERPVAPKKPPKPSKKKKPFWKLYNKNEDD